MNHEDMLKTLVETEQRSKSNTHRINKLEESNEVLHEMATSLGRMALSQEHQGKQLNKLSGDVEELKQRPSYLWKKLVELSLAAAVSGAAGYLIALLK